MGIVLRHLVGYQKPGSESMTLLIPVAMGDSGDERERLTSEGCSTLI